MLKSRRRSSEYLVPLTACLTMCVTISTKFFVYRAVCISIVHYGCEVLTIYKTHISDLQPFCIHCLQQDLRLTRKDSALNAIIFWSASCGSIGVFIIQQVAPLLVRHVYQLLEDPLPSQLFSGELITGCKNIRSTSRIIWRLP